MSRRASYEAAVDRQAFFTAEDACVRTWQVAQQHARLRGFEPGDLVWVESSAGAGVFLDNCPQGERIMGFDIHPLHPKVVKADWMKLPRNSLPDDWALIGNPPFGNRGAIIARFINMAFARGCKFAVVIMPGVLATHFGQRRISKDIGICGEPELLDGSKAFVLPDGTAHKVSTCRIAVWERMATRAAKPPDSHPDFSLKWTFPGSKARPAGAKAAKLHWEAGGWCLAVAPATGRTLPPGTPFSTELGGAWYLVFDHTGSPERTVERIKRLPWKRMSAAAAEAGAIAPTGRYIYEAYAAMYGPSARRTGKPRTSHPDFRMRQWAGHLGEPPGEWDIFLHDSRGALIVDRGSVTLSGTGRCSGATIEASPEVIERIRAIDWDAVWDSLPGMIHHYTAEVIANAYAGRYGWGERQPGEQLELV